MLEDMGLGDGLCDKEEIMFKLSDDGTLDTVVTCEDCGEEVRYTYMPEDLPIGQPVETYEEFIEWCLKDAAEDHECDRSWCDSDQEEVSDVK